MKRAALPLSFSAIGSGRGKPPPYEGFQIIIHPVRWEITAVPGPLWEGAVTK